MNRTPDPADVCTVVIVNFATASTFALMGCSAILAYRVLRYALFGASRKEKRGE